MKTFIFFIFFFLFLPTTLDMVGCFMIPRAQIPSLMKPPQSPETVDTKFLLLTRRSLTNGTVESVEWLLYGDNQKSLSNSTFDHLSSTKIIIHGFKGSGQDKGALDIAAAFLKLVSTISFNDNCYNRIKIYVVFTHLWCNVTPGYYFENHCGCHNAGLVSEEPFDTAAAFLVNIISFNLLVAKMCTVPIFPFRMLIMRRLVVILKINVGCHNEVSG